MNTSSLTAWVGCVLSGMMFCSLASASNPGVLAPPKRTGGQIYRQQCASCHGLRGEGDKEKYPRPLAGDRSVNDLVRFISKRMPKDDPGKCVGDDARQVAAYIYEAFYSPAAQARQKQPRVELARLTVAQYRNAVADLIGNFRTAKHGNAEKSGSSEHRESPRNGLRGKYYNILFRKPERDGDTKAGGNLKRVFERIDPEIRFDFGEGSPDPNNEQMEDKQFYVRWRGSLLVPETGWYEFILRTEKEHGVRLWVNSLDRPLIEDWVKTEDGNKTEHRGSIFLLGGRAYPLQLDFSKQHRVNVFSDVPDVNPKAEAAKASLSLQWKPPQAAIEVIPQRLLTTDPGVEMFVPATAFPPDDRNAGYDRGTSISKAWDEAVTAGAVEVMTYTAAHVRELAGVGVDAPDARDRLREFCLRFAERAFRRPLAAEEKRVFVDRQFQVAGGDLETAVKRTTALVVMSPQFLYREVGGQEGYDAASRLSFGLWDSLPDAELLQAAVAGRLTTREQVARQAERMLTDERTRAKLRQFLLRWLKAEQIDGIVKNVKLFPGFSSDIAADLRTSLELFLDEVVWSEASDFRRLFLADGVYLNGRLAQFYSVRLPADAPFQKVAAPSGINAGVLSHPYLMAKLAHAESGSPILRGVFLMRNILGRSLPPPPQAFDLLPPSSHPELTTRERVVLQTRPQACMVCHGTINQLGFTLENFDAMGRFRDRENGKPIDATGVYQTRKDQEVKLGGARDLAQFLAQSEEVQEAFVEQLFQHLVKQPIASFGPRKRSEWRRAFAAADFNIRRLVVAMMADSTLIARKSP